MRLGTRGSALALAQADLVAAGLLEAGLQEAEVLRSADLYDHADAAEQRRGVRSDKSRWVSHLERALLDRHIDLAVHSAKDVPGELAVGLALFGALSRGAPEDVIVGVLRLEDLDRGARVGTGSLRRAAQLRAARADLEVVPLEGNVDTRLRTLGDGEASLDAIVLARAGLERLGVRDVTAGTLDPTRFVPAPGQGIIALEGRADDRRAQSAAASVSDVRTLACLQAERALANALEASCDTPLGAHAAPVSAEAEAEAEAEVGAAHIQLRAWVGLPDGCAWIMDELSGPIDEAPALGLAVAARMRSAGADDLLAEAQAASLGH
ncbi:MAG: hydroxymethylbilane synthase [Solirubrobacteraceae bacterium]